MNIKKSNVFLYPLENKVVFPYHQYTFNINSNHYNPDLYDNLIGFVTKLDDTNLKTVSSINGYSRYGTLLKVHKSDFTGHRIIQNKKIYNFNLIGLTFARFKILTLTESEGGKAIATIQIFSDAVSKQAQAILQKKNLIHHLKKQMKVFYECKLKLNEAELKKQLVEGQKSLNKIIYKCANELDLGFVQKLKILEMERHDMKIEILLQHLKSRTDNVKSILEIEEKVRQDMSKVFKKPVNNAKSGFSFGFGTKGFGAPDNSDLQAQINSKNLPPHVKEEIQKEIKRMGTLPQSSSVARKYIETLLQIPWNQSTQQIKDIALAEKILNDDHTGLKDVKQRILEFLAVKFRKGNSKGNIICLHGPPGVGKTSIAKSIAKALGRQFTRISLGGMNDQAELRGHRRTYVAALPGVIIRALIKAKSNNPVILLDQIQKIGKSYKGDPEHALLQILDPSQNSSFIDHYVSIPVDLSKVMFICTANSLELSVPLLNRLELIEVSGYTREQKFLIAKNHLIPIQIQQNGVAGQIEFQDEALKQIIQYSNEMGVRELERKLAKICRKVARNNKVGSKQKITFEKVEKYLGKKHKPEKWTGIGVVNGMAWTSLGGQLLMVQSIAYPNSKGQIKITGQLGDVMKESVNIALSWIKAHMNDFELWGFSNEKLKQKLDEIEKTTVHIHFPEGGTKKDGPSAGVTIVTSFVSLFLKFPVRQNLSMTGEITLSGKVLPVGGIREKCIAAIYEGIQHIIIPYGNLKDLDKIEPQLKKKAHFYPVKEIKEVLSISFPTLLQAVPPKL